MENNKYENICSLIRDSNKLIVNELEELRKTVNDLRVDQAARKEREIKQAEINTELREFIDTNRPVLIRVAKTQERTDKIALPIISAFILSFLYYLFKWKK